jgi:hypothetical protein
VDRCHGEIVERGEVWWLFKGKIDKFSTLRRILKKQQKQEIQISKKTTNRRKIEMGRYDMNFIKAHSPPTTCSPRVAA